MDILQKVGWVALGCATIALFGYLASCSSEHVAAEDHGEAGTSLAAPDVTNPLSAMVAVRFTGVPAGFPGGSAPALLPANTNIADYVKSLVAHANANYDFGTNTWGAGTVPAGFTFPLANTNNDSSRQIAGLTHDIVLKWMDPITKRKDGPRWGANADYNAYFGDGWNSAANGWTDGPHGVLGAAPMWSGNSDAGYIWTNFEYISGNPPTTTSAPTDSHLTFARMLQNSGILSNNVTRNTWTQADVDTYINWYKKELGGAYVRIVKDGTGKWTVDLTGQHNRRFDATSSTLARMTGYTLSGVETSDNGSALPANIVPGIMGDCSGGQSPGVRSSPQKRTYRITTATSKPAGAAASASPRGRALIPALR